MNDETAEELLNYFQQIDCPFTCDVDASYLPRLLLIPSQHRMRILSWLLSSIDEEVANEIESFNRNPENFKGLQEIDGEVQLLTDISASLGLCLSTDFHLIRGKAAAETHIAFWRNLLAAVSAVPDNDHGSVSYRSYIVNHLMESILGAGNIASALFSTTRVLSPAIVKELEISQKKLMLTKTSKDSASDDLSDKLEHVQIELDKQLNILRNLKHVNPDLSVTAVDSSLVETLNRSLGLTLNDLTQLQTSFLQTFLDHFQPYCDKEQLKFTKLGSIIYQVDEDLSSLLKLLENMTTLKSCRQSLIHAEKESDCKS